MGYLHGSCYELTPTAHSLISQAYRYSSQRGKNPNNRNILSQTFYFVNTKYLYLINAKKADALHRRIGKGECYKITLFLNYRRDN